MVSCTSAGVVARSRAATGSAGTNMCIAEVPLSVMSASGHNGIGARRSDSGTAGRPARGRGEGKVVAGHGVRMRGTPLRKWT